MQDASVSGLTAFAFNRDGFVEPFRLFTTEDCRVIACHFKQAQQSPPANWPKDLALTDRFIRNLASHPRLLSLVAELIGAQYRALGLQIHCPGTGRGSRLAHRHRIVSSRRWFCIGLDWAEQHLP